MIAVPYRRTWRWWCHNLPVDPDLATTSVSCADECLPLKAPTKEKLWSDHPVTAVDIERLGHNAIAVQGSQEHSRCAVILWAPYPPEREHFPDLP